MEENFEFPSKDEPSSQWESDILGSVANILTQLKTWDQAIREIIQNADDSYATEIQFEINNEGLVVTNNKQLTVCSKPKMKRVFCDLKLENENRLCDVHALKTFSSQNKKNNSEATGKFGVGFSSVFLFSDYPVIKSGNVRIRFLLEEGEVPIEQNDENFNGTKIELPWATIQKSPIRRGIQKNSILLEQVPQIASEIANSVSKSMLFVKYLKQAKVILFQKNILEMTIEKSGTELLIKDLVKNKSTRWFLLESGYEDELELVKLRNENLAFSARKTRFEILLPMDIDSNFEGFVYATLATNQKTFMPFHVNGSFFPDTSRNNLPFHDKSGERDPAALWNRSLIYEISKFLAQNLLEIQTRISNLYIWQILLDSYGIYKSELAPGCFSSFWVDFKKQASEIPIILNQHGNLCTPKSVSLLKYEDESFSNLLSKLGIDHQEKFNANFMEICTQLGTKNIDQNLLAAQLEVLNRRSGLEPFLKEQKDRTSLYSLINKILAETDLFEERLAKIPIWRDSRGSFQTFSSLLKVENVELLRKCELLFKNLKYSSNEFQKESNLSKRMRDFTGDLLVQYLSVTENLQNFLQSDLFQDDSVTAFDLMERIFTTEPCSQKSVEDLKSLHIWPHTDNQIRDLFGSALPGSFEDPIGVGKLLAQEKIGPRMCDFLNSKMNVRRLNLEVYICEILTKYFEKELITFEQSRELFYQFYINRDSLSSKSKNVLRDMPFVKNISGDSVNPSSCFYPSQELLDICSSKHFNFLDLKISENIEARQGEIDSFLHQIGVTFAPNLDILISSWINIQSDLAKRDFEIDRLSKIATKILELIRPVRDVNEKSILFKKFLNFAWPCQENCSVWHSGTELIHPRWKNAVCSREKQHSVAVKFGNIPLVEICETFSLLSYPSISSVIDHLHHLVSELVSPHKDFYKFLTWLVKNGKDFDREILAKLRYEPLFYSSERFLIPQDIYTEIPEQLLFLKNYINLMDIHDDFEPLWIFFGIGAFQEERVPRYVPLIKETLQAKSDDVDAEDVYRQAISIIGIAFARSLDWAISYVSEFSSQEFLLTFSGTWISPANAILPDDLDWSSALSLYCNEYFVGIEPAAYEFAAEAGASKLSEILMVSEESLAVSGPSEKQMMADFNIRFQGIYALMANQIIDAKGGGRNRYLDQSQALMRLRNLEIYSVEQIDVEVTLKSNTINLQYFVENAPTQFLTKRNMVIYVRDKREDFLSIFSSLIRHFIPSMSTGDVKSLATTFLVIIRSHPEEILSWLEDNDFLKNDIQIPERTANEINLVSLEMPVDIEESIIDEDGSEYNSYLNLDEVSDDTENFDIASLSNSHENQAVMRIGSSNSSKSDDSVESIPISEELGQNQRVSNMGSNSILSESDLDSDLPIGTFRRNFERNNQSNRAASTKVRRRKSGFAHAEAEKGDGMGNVHNEKVEAAAIDWIVKKEWEIQREIVNMNETVKNNRGYDLISVSKLDPMDRRLIEVKSCASNWPEFGVAMSRAQFEFSILNGFKSWLYVVENALDSDEYKRLHRIHNPWDNIKSIYFDSGWKDLAAVSFQQNPIMVVRGMRIRHKDEGFGWLISDPKRQGHNIFFVVQFDSGENPRSIQWDDELMEVIDGEDEV